uniref:Uncharacterized protein n=1 Tax=Denticeps clupeoides TaxID=299321 RepID=A0AAY4EYU3_9TELE
MEVELNKRKPAAIPTGADFFLSSCAGSSSGNSSPEYTRKEYGEFADSLTPDEEHHVESECPRVPVGTELDDVKRLLKGNRSESISPPRSPTNTLPIPKKASVSEQHSGTVSAFQNNLSLGSTSVAGVVPAGNAGFFFCLLSFIKNATNKQANGTELQLCSYVLFFFFFFFTVYGMQNNLAGTTGNSVMANGVNTHTGGHLTARWSASIFFNILYAGKTKTSSDDVFVNDYKFMLLEKEKSAAKKESERLITAKDTGKQFTTHAAGAGLGSYSNGSLKKEKFMSSADTTAVRDEGNGLCKMVYVHIHLFRLQRYVICQVDPLKH